MKVEKQHDFWEKATYREDDHNVDILDQLWYEESTYGKREVPTR